MNNALNSLNNKHSVINFNNINCWEHNINDMLIYINNPTNKFNFNNIYMNIYFNFINNDYDLKLFFNKFDIFIKNNFNDEDDNILDYLYNIDKIINKIHIFMSIFTNEDIKSKLYIIIFNNKCFSTKFNKILFDKIILLNNNSNQLLVLLNSMLNNTKTDINFYDIIIINIINNLNIHLDLMLKSKKIDIYILYNTIYNIGIYINEYFINNQTIYEYCYEYWFDYLIDNFNINNKELEKTLVILHYIDQYIDKNILSKSIYIKLKKYIDDSLLDFNPIIEHINDKKLFVVLINLMEIIYIVLLYWIKYNNIYYNKIVDIINNIFTDDIIIYYHLHYNNFIINLSNALLYSINITFLTTSAHKSISIFNNNIQYRYLNLFKTFSIDKIKEMYKIDKMIINSINSFLNNFFDIKKHLEKYIEQLNCILNNIELLFKINYEIKQIKIAKNNIILNNYFDNKDINYILISGFNSWSIVSNDLINYTEIKYNSELNEYISLFNNFYKQKCPHRKLKWLNNYSTVILNYKSYQLKLSLAQANILMIFNNHLDISLNDIYDIILIYLNDFLKNNINLILESLIDMKLILFNNNKYYINENFNL
jgi:hypothetical protein